MNGFRAWTDVLCGNSDFIEYRPCHCGWANGLEHYRVNRQFL
jgi:hypothetical protein